MVQGEPLRMVLYGLALIPLARMCRISVLYLIHAWYADDAALAGPLVRIAEAKQLLLDHGPARGYYMDPEKSVLICSPELTEEDLAPLDGFHFRRETGER